MEEESVYNSFPELKEFENKIGRKTPDVLLRWMDEAARGRENSPELLHIQENGTWGECLNDKISQLKLEMGGLQSAGLPAVYSAVCGLQGCLRAADVQILHQLLVVQKSMEAVRWMLQEEQATLESHSSSLTGSQCSLADSAPGITSPGEGPSPTLMGLHDPAKPSREPEQEPDWIYRSHRCSNMTSDKRPPSDVALCVSTGGSGQTWFSTTTTTTHPAQTKQLGQQDPQQGAPQWAGLEPKRTSFPEDKRRGVSGEDQVQDQTGQTGPAPCSLPEETLWASARNMEQEEQEEEEEEEEEQSVPGCGMLLGYDAQWCWVESQDDVTFL